VGHTEGLNTHAHSEQAQPRKRSFFNPHQLGVLWESLAAGWRNHFVTVSDTAFVEPKPLRSNGKSRSCVPVRVLRYEGIVFGFFYHPAQLGACCTSRVTV
jgi:hypothetical protein